MRIQVEHKKIGQLELSYLLKAPDHGKPELAVVLPGDRRRIVPVAFGEEATRLWESPLSEEDFLELAYAEIAALVSD